MKTTIAIMGAMLLAASAAEAVDIQGKWGIGASVIDRGGEISLIRGHSERSAWLFDLRLSQQSLFAQTDPSSLPSLAPTTTSRDQITVSAGPGYRRYARAAEGFSPYWDTSAHAVYARLHDRRGPDAFTIRQLGAEGVVSFGLEYFTRWHFSVAAHSRLVSFAWTHDRSRQDRGTGLIRSSGHTEQASIGLSPAIFVRGYF